MPDSGDRRDGWALKGRPEWVSETNRLTQFLDIKAVVPLDEASLLDHARRNTGLDDFGEDGWREHFRYLLQVIEDEAKLNFVGRVLTRSDMLTYLEARLRVTDAYKQHPEIEDEVITEPVFILGFGRSGTTILHETLSQDPQFRSVRRWEGLFPCPPPEAATYETDPRIAKAQGRVDFVHGISPDWASMHAWGGNLPVEDIEFTYTAFFSEVWQLGYQIPSWEAYFASHSPDAHFTWHKRLLKLLQWKHKKPHWLFKNPTHMPRIPALLTAYPDAKIVLPHRDPVTTADSVINVGGVIISWRTDSIYGDNKTGTEWLDVESRVKMWDDVMEWIDSDLMKPGFYGNIIYNEFMDDPMAAIAKLYEELRLPLTDEARQRMTSFLNERHQGSHGNKNAYAKSTAEDPRTVAERKAYKRYQDRFGVPNDM
jgi:hypothetical protein